MSEQQTGFIKFRRVDSISGTPDPRTLYLINKYSGPEEDAVITHIDLQFGGFSVGRMDYTTELDSNNDVILSFTYNDSSKELEVKANLKRKNAGTNLLKIDSTGWYVETADVKTIIDSYIVTTFPTTATDETVPSTKLVKTSLDNKEDSSNKVTTVRDSVYATHTDYPTEKAVRTELDNRVIKNPSITKGTKTKITYDAKGLVTGGADLAETDIPELPQTKITGLEASLDNRVIKNDNITGGTKTKITYDAKGLVTKGEDLAETDIPELPQSKITNLETDLGNKENTDNKVETVRVDGKATDENYPSEKAVRKAINAAVQGLTVENHTHVISDVEGLQDSLDSKEVSDNKVTSWGTTPTDTKYPSEKLVKDNLDTKVDKNASITKGTKTKITYDAKGLVTKGEDLAETDIPELPQSKITNLETALSGKANSVHTHESADITDLQDSLDAKESAANKVTSWGTTPTDTKYPSEKLVKDNLDAKVDIEVGKGLSTKDYTEAEQTKLAGIAEGAEVNVQSDWSQTVTTADDYIKNKPTLSTVATTGSFNDLIDTPEGIDPTDFEKIADRVITVRASASATDTNYPTEKAVRTELDTKADVTNLEDALALKENEANKVATISASTSATDTNYPTEKAVRTELDLREALVNKRTTIRASGTATDVAYPTEKAVRTALDDKIDKTSIYVGAGKTLPTDLPSDASSSDSLVMSQKASILSFSKRGHTHAEFDTKVNKNADITAGTDMTKISYDAKGLVTGGTSLSADDIPQLSPSKITQDANNRFTTDAEKSTWNRKQSALTAGDGIRILGNVISANSGPTVEKWNTTATKTLALSDANRLFVCSYYENQTLTIPSTTSVPFPIGTMITFLLTGNYKVTFSSASGVTLTSIDGLVELATQYSMASLIKIAINTWQLVGALE